MSDTAHTVDHMRILHTGDWHIGRTFHGHATLDALRGVLGALTALGRWWLYPLLWLLPLATVYQLASRVRNIAEHAMVPDNDDAFRNARTTYAGSLVRAVFAPYWVNYHLEHHLAMFIPCYRLPEAHRMLLAKGYGPRMEIKPSYGAVLSAATSRP